MERFTRDYSPEIRNSKSSSIYSDDSFHDSGYSNYSVSTPSVHRRAVSYTPSYMAAPIVRKPVASKPCPPSVSVPFGDMATPTQESVATFPPVARGTLLVAIAALPHPSTISYLQSMLKKQPYKQIVILGNAAHEAELKRLKVDVYALLGKLGKEVALHVDLQNSWSDATIDTAISEAVKDDNAIYGFLCCPDYGNFASSSLDIMALDEEQLASPWKSSVGFLHSLAKKTIPNFQTDGNTRRQPALFLVTAPSERSTTSALYSAGCRTVMTLLVEANAGKNLTVDYAQNVLLPEPEASKADGTFKLSMPNGSATHEIEDEPPPESPTKLWLAWAAD